MGKTLILVIDRDDDFGSKAKVESPIVGFDKCKDAAVALGIADPEDSDTNALFGGLNYYQENRDKMDLEIALICGNKTIGALANKRLIEQTKMLIDEIDPDDYVLMTDGAEDNDAFKMLLESNIHLPLIEYRIIRVKQAAGVESAFYYLKNALGEPTKRKRFLAPLSGLLIVISVIYIISSFYTSGDIQSFVSRATTSFIVFVIGVVLAIYAYNVPTGISDFIEKWKNEASSGSITVVFFSASLALALVGIVVGIYSTTEVYLEHDSQMILVFIVYSFWFFIFAFMIYAFGAVVNSYLNSGKIKYSFIALILNTVSVGLVVNGILDYMMTYVGLYTTLPLMYMIEIVTGFVLALVSSALHIKIKSMTTVSAEQAA